MIGRKIVKIGLYLFFEKSQFIVSQLCIQLLKAVTVIPRMEVPIVFLEHGLTKFPIFLVEKFLFFVFESLLNDKTPVIPKSVALRTFLDEFVQEEPVVLQLGQRVF